MNYTFIHDFFTCYGMPTILIAAVTSAFCLIMNKIFKEKYPRLFKTQIPFLFCLVVHFIYDMIFISNAFIFTEQAFTAGILSGSLSIIMNSLIIKIKRSEFIGLSTTALLIEGLLDGVVPETCLAATAVAVENIISDTERDKEIEELANEIAEILKLNTDKQMNEAELKNTAKMIIQAVNSL